LDEYKLYPIIQFTLKLQGADDYLVVVLGAKGIKVRAKANSVKKISEKNEYEKEAGVLSDNGADSLPQ
jgi:hypothetical protein